jgi:hypothetical protein
LIKSEQKFEDGKMQSEIGQTKRNDTVIWVYHTLNRKLRLGQWKKYDPESKDTTLIGNYISQEG